MQLIESIRDLLNRSELQVLSEIARCHQKVGKHDRGLALPILRFFIPFFSLLCRPAKRKTGVIGFFAAYSLLVVYLDYYWVVMPVHSPKGIDISWIDFATLAATVSVCALAFWSRFRRHSMVPVGDLRLEQSLHFENA